MTSGLKTLESEGAEECVETRGDAATHVVVEPRFLSEPLVTDKRRLGVGTLRRAPFGRQFDGGQQVPLFGAAPTNQRARIHRGSFEDHEQSTSQGRPWRWLLRKGKPGAQLHLRSSVR